MSSKNSMYILLLTLFGSSLYTFPLTRFKIFCHYSLCCISGIAGLIYHYILFFMLLNFILFLFIYLFLLYNVVLVLPYFNMNLPLRTRVPHPEPPPTSLPIPSPGSSQCTSPNILYPASNLD